MINKGEKTKKLAVYVHGKGGNAAEAEHYKTLFPECEVIGFDYRAENPWEAKTEFPAFFDEQKKHFDEIYLIANSIGAFFFQWVRSRKNRCEKRL